MNEIERIISEYERRDSEGKAKKQWTYFNQANLFIIHQRESAIIKLLRSYGITDLSDRLILDVGCGFGGELQKFCDYGAHPENLYGIDLMEGRIKQAKDRYPLFNLIVSNGETLPFPDDSFDIILQFTCFSSILDDKVKTNISGEMLRVLKRQGIIIWYEMKSEGRFLKIIQNLIKLLSLIKRGSFSIENIKAYVMNKGSGITSTKTIGIAEIDKLYEGCVFKTNTVTLYYPFIQLLVGQFRIVAEVLSGLKIFNTHYLIGIQKK